MFLLNDYQNLLKILHHTEIKGLEEAKVLTILGTKLEHRIANWIHGDKPEPEAPPPDVS